MTVLAPSEPASQSDANAPRLVRGGGSKPALGRGKSLLLPVLLLVSWEALSRFGVFAPNLLPAPSKVLGAVADLAADGELLEHIAITLYRVALGFLIGGGAATLLGAATGYSKTARTARPAAAIASEHSVHRLGATVHSVARHL